MGQTQCSAEGLSGQFVTGHNGESPVDRNLSAEELSAEKKYGHPTTLVYYGSSSKKKRKKKKKKKKNGAGTLTNCSTSEGENGGPAELASAARSRAVDLDHIPLSDDDDEVFLDLEKDVDDEVARFGEMLENVHIERSVSNDELFPSMKIKFKSQNPLLKSKLMGTLADGGDHHNRPSPPLPSTPPTPHGADDDAWWNPPEPIAGVGW